MNDEINDILSEQNPVEQVDEQRKKAKAVHILKLVLRILLGGFFISTAILKLLSLDNFEIYIYSFHIFNYILCTVVARLVIMAELLLGFLLIAKIFYKQAWWATMAMMMGFTLLLVYTAIFRNDANCHCMGDLVQVKPSLSIIKNVVTIALLLLIYKENDYQFKGKTAVGIVGLVAAFAVPFCLFPMDTVWNMFDRKGQVINEERFHEFMMDSIAQSIDIDEGHYIVGYLAAGCKYCKVSGKKINSIIENNHLDPDKVVIFIWGKEESIAKFKEETGAQNFRYVTIDPITAIEVVNGQFPTFIYVTDGEKTKSVDIRGLVEPDIVNHLSE